MHPIEPAWAMENAQKLIRIYMGGLIVGVNTLYMLSCFLKQFGLVGKWLSKEHHNGSNWGEVKLQGLYHFSHFLVPPAER